jgi:protein-L-isoaspartate(D-aspartate) O-methyltransferase
LLTERGAVETPDANPEHIYHNVLTPLDPAKDINNGTPGLWAEFIEQLNVRPGERVTHVGAGTGYYTAILAELVGGGGSILAFEIEPTLASKARRNLKPWPNVSVSEANGFEAMPSKSDIIVMSAGASHFPLGWLEALRDGGRLMLPLTVSGEWPIPDGSGTWKGGRGRMLRVERNGNRFAARFLRGVGFINCVGGRLPEADERLRTAFERGGAEQVRSVRPIAEPPDETCWLLGTGWWLSTSDIS